MLMHTGARRLACCRYAEAVLLIQHQQFDTDTGPPRSSMFAEAIFRWCDFSQLEIDGGVIDGAFLGCELRDVDWYWPLFNTALIAHTSFTGCTFRGASFRGCELVQCRFYECRFVLNNLGGSCRFEDCLIAECTFDKCEVVPESKMGRPVFVNTRWYSCSQNQSPGLEGLF
jgi:uncharacterized protein YjbI with pentapeptide repeats